MRSTTEINRAIRQLRAVKKLYNLELQRGVPDGIHSSRIIELSNTINLLNWVLGTTDKTRWNYLVAPILTICGRINRALIRNEQARVDANRDKIAREQLAWKNAALTSEAMTAREQSEFLEANGWIFHDGYWRASIYSTGWTLKTAVAFLISGRTEQCRLQSKPSDRPHR